MLVRQAALRGELLGMCAFPVNTSLDLRNAQENIHGHHPLQCKLHEELKSGVGDNQVQGPFTLGLIESLLGALHLAPIDIKF